MQYTDDRISIQHVDRRPESGLVQGFMRNLLQFKFPYWTYEEEARAIIRLDHSMAENGSYFFSFDRAVMLKEVMVGPVCQLLVEQVRELVHSMHQHAPIVKSQLAFKRLDVVPFERSLPEESAYWEAKGLPAPHKLTHPVPTI